MPLKDTVLGLIILAIPAYIFYQIFQISWPADLETDVVLSAGFISVELFILNARPFDWPEIFVKNYNTQAGK